MVEKLFSEPAGFIQSDLQTHLHSGKNRVNAAVAQ